MKIIAQRDPTTVLADIGDGMGVVVDTRTGTIFPPKSLDSIFARGYWEDPDPSVDWEAVVLTAEATFVRK